MMKHVRNMVKKGRLGSVLCLLGLGLMMMAATGCGDDGNNTTSGTTGTAPTTTAPNTGTSAGDASAAATGGATATTTTSGLTVQQAGILWKPVSEGNLRLVVLLPTSMGVPGAKILNANGTLNDTGSYYGSPAEHGSRAIYRFNHSGSYYPNPCYLQVGTVVYTVNNPGVRKN